MSFSCRSLVNTVGVAAATAAVSLGSALPLPLTALFSAIATLMTSGAVKYRHVSNHKRKIISDAENFKKEARNKRTSNPLPYLLSDSEEFNILLWHVKEWIPLEFKIPWFFAIYLQSEVV